MTIIVRSIQQAGKYGTGGVAESYTLIHEHRQIERGLCGLLNPQIPPLAMQLLKKKGYTSNSF